MGHAYDPDFLAPMATPEREADTALILEMKEFEDNQTAAKHDGANRLVRALNAWAGWAAGIFTSAAIHRHP